MKVMNASLLCCALLACGGAGRSTIDESTAAQTSSDPETGTGEKKDDPKADPPAEPAGDPKADMEPAKDPATDAKSDPSSDPASDPTPPANDPAPTGAGDPPLNDPAPTGSTGSTGESASCSSDEDCPQGPLGDCVATVCQKGACVDVAAEWDYSSDKNICTLDYCEGKTLKHDADPAKDGVSCNLKGGACCGGVCTGSLCCDGKIVDGECCVDADCGNGCAPGTDCQSIAAPPDPIPGPTCQNNFCCPAGKDCQAF